jgi:hypothetical protein
MLATELVGTLAAKMIAPVAKANPMYLNNLKFLV